MYNQVHSWENLGRIIAPDSTVEWMRSSCGPACAEIIDDEKGDIRIYLAGRDDLNRSHIGYVDLNIFAPLKIVTISSKAIIQLGELGTFDENGTSYPYPVLSGKELFIYYNGWMPTKLTPFQIHLGLAYKDKEGGFEKISRAPILERSNDDPLNIGSVAVMNDNGIWKMWYTSFIKWGESSDEPKHHYHIKYAESKNGIAWIRKNQVCITFQSEDEFAISRPTVIKHGGLYHMWFCYRGREYRIGYAFSKDGIDWERRDELAGISGSDEGWDSRAQCYPYVFKFKDHLYMLYCGNNYGKEGVGLSKLRL